MIAQGGGGARFGAMGRAGSNLLIWGSVVVWGGSAMPLSVMGSNTSASSRRKGCPTMTAGRCTALRGIAGREQDSGHIHKRPARVA